MAEYRVKLGWFDKRELAERAARDARNAAEAFPKDGDLDAKLDRFYEITFHTVEQQLSEYVAQGVTRADKGKCLLHMKKGNGCRKVSVMAHRQAMTVLDNKIAELLLEEERDCRLTQQRRDELESQIMACEQALRVNRAALLHGKCRLEEAEFNRRSGERRGCMTELANEYIRVGEKLFAEQRLLRERAFAKIRFYQGELRKCLPGAGDCVVPELELVSRCTRQPERETAELLDKMRRFRRDLARENRGEQAGAAQPAAIKVPAGKEGD